MKRFSRSVLGCLIAAIGSTALLRADDKVIVHEWGTFTCLQDENGRAIGGINVDDEPVPDFVYGSRFGDVISLNENLGLPPYSIYASKAGPLPLGYPAVTLRLETPVLYIYPPKGESAASVPPLDVQVEFNGGYLSQYYPYAEMDTKDLRTEAHVSLSRSSRDQLAGTRGTLDWKGVRLGSTGTPVETDDKVWTTPRETAAPLVEVEAPVVDGQATIQSEHFLFYRGVGQVDSPLAIGPVNGAAVTGHRGYSLAPHYPGRFDSCGWLTEIRADGSCAMVELPEVRIPEKAALILEGGDFQTKSFAPNNLNKLKASMQSALVREGLYPDEATAMLKTWELSYFKSPGLRFFYIVPRGWVDKVLPLKVTGAPVEITRVMVGRIELITDSQRAALARMAAGPCVELGPVKAAAFASLQKSNLTQADRREFLSGEKPLTDLGISIPPLVQDYLSLGRFRDALVVREQQLHPSAALARFIKDNQLVPNVE